MTEPHYLVVEHELSGGVGLVEEVEVVQHRGVGEHEVHDLMAKEAAQLSHDLKQRHGCSVEVLEAKGTLTTAYR